MKSKAPLSLMEQLVMLLVFALAAALCLQVFVLSGQMSRMSEARDRGVTAVQEVIKASGGDVQQCEMLLGGSSDGQLWQIGYDADWKEVPMEQASYQLRVTPVATEIPGLGSAQVSALEKDGDILFQVTISWQEVTGE